MVISDAVSALEDLKNNLVDIKNANENVKMAVDATLKVCEAFAECSGKLESLPEAVMEPISTKVSEIASASSQMVQKCEGSVMKLHEETKGITGSFKKEIDALCNKVEKNVSGATANIKENVSKIAKVSSQMERDYGGLVNGLRKETAQMAAAFNTEIAGVCKRIQDNVAEFHRELETFELKMDRLLGRVEGKTDAVIDETRKMNAAVEKGIEDLALSQSKLDCKTKEMMLAIIKGFSDAALAQSEFESRIRKALTGVEADLRHELSVIKNTSAMIKKILVVFTLFALGYLILKGFGIVP